MRSASSRAARSRSWLPAVTAVEDGKSGGGRAGRPSGMETELDMLVAALAGDGTMRARAEADGRCVVALVPLREIRDALLGIAGTWYALDAVVDRKSTRLNSSHANISYAVFCLKKKK